MTELTYDLTRPLGRYGVDGDYRLIPAPVVFVGYLLACLAAAALGARWLLIRRVLPGAAAALATGVLVGAGAGILRFSRRGKFEVWARLLTSLRLRGDERVLDLGYGRGAVLLAAAKLVPRGKAVGVDIWRADQTGNSMQATLANVNAEGVADRIELYTRDMTELRFADASFDLVVSSLAIHNLPDIDARLSAVDEAIRVLRPGGRTVIADLGFTRRYAARLRQRGMVDVKREDLGRRGWWGLPLVRTHAVTATKPNPPASGMSIRDWQNGDHKIGLASGGIRRDVSSSTGLGTVPRHAAAAISIGKGAAERRRRRASSSYGRSGNRRAGALARSARYPDPGRRTGRIGGCG
jgi:arsenite methyltransferase